MPNQTIIFILNIIFESSNWLLKSLNVKRNTYIIFWAHFYGSQSGKWNGIGDHPSNKVLPECHFSRYQIWTSTRYSNPMIFNTIIAQLSSWKGLLMVVIPLLINTIYISFKKKKKRKIAIPHMVKPRQI